MAAFLNVEMPTDWASYYQNQMAEFFDTDGFAGDPAPQPDCTCPIEPETCRFLP